MFIIEMQPLSNGAHRNQKFHDSGPIPDEWAIVSEDMPIPGTFPFVGVEAENGVVTAITPGVVPETEPAFAIIPTPQEDADAMFIDHEYRLTLLELGVTGEV